MENVVEIKVPTNMKMDNVSTQMELSTPYMKSIKKIKINKPLVLDKTGNQIGKIYLKRISDDLPTKEMKSYFIEFKKGAKSKIHLHDSDQIIVGIAGSGVLAIFSKIDYTKKEATLKIENTLNLEEGEAVLIPAGTLHWHGARENENSSQLSFMKDGNTFWF